MNATPHFQTLSSRPHWCWPNSGHLLASQRNERAQPPVAKVKSTPDKQGHIDRCEDIAEERIADAHVGSDCTAKIASQQDRSKNGGTWNCVQNNTDEQNDPNRSSETQGIAELDHSFHNRRRAEQFHG